MVEFSEDGISSSSHEISFPNGAIILSAIQEPLIQRSIAVSIGNSNNRRDWKFQWPNKLTGKTLIQTNTTNIATTRKTTMIVSRLFIICFLLKTKIHSKK